MAHVLSADAFFLYFADEHAHVMARLDQLAGELHIVLQRPAFLGRSAAGMDGDDALFGGAPVSSPALLDGTEHLRTGGLDCGETRQLIRQPIADMSRKWIIISGARLEGDQLCFR